MAKMGLFWGPRSAQGHGMDGAHPIGPTGGSRDQIMPPGAARDPPGPPKGTFWAKMGPFGGPMGAIEVC